jgi:proline racemase
MGSPAHLANLLNGAFDSVGLGIVENGGVLYVVEDFAHRVPDLNNDDAAERVANQFSKFRQTAGAAKLPHVSNGRLQQMACVMAQHEVANEKGPSSLPRAHVAASYESADLSRLPADVARLSTLNGIGYFSVGVCYARTPRYPTGLYWVTIVLFE